jgi:hypothetical protein
MRVSLISYDRSSLTGDTCPRIGAACEQGRLYSLFELQLSFWSSRLRTVIVRHKYPAYRRAAAVRILPIANPMRQVFNR